MSRVFRPVQLGYRDVLAVTSWIYLLAESDTGEVRYVGRAANPEQRLVAHLRSKRSRHVYPWVREVEARGARVEMLLIREVPAGEDVDAAEREEMAKRVGLTDLLNVFLWSHDGLVCNIARARASRAAKRDGDGFVSPSLPAEFQLAHVPPHRSPA